MLKSAVKILLVDDSEIMLGLLASLLKKQGFTVTTAKDLTSAVEAFSRHKPDLILMDFVLEPTRTGIEALGAIFSLAGSARPLAAILTQGALTPLDEQKAAAWGVVILQKPVRGKEAAFLDLIGELAAKAKPTV